MIVILVYTKWLRFMFLIMFSVLMFVTNTWRSMLWKIHLWIHLSNLLFHCCAIRSQQKYFHTISISISIYIYYNPYPYPLLCPIIYVYPYHIHIHYHVISISYILYITYPCRSQQNIYTHIHMNYEHRSKKIDHIKSIWT